ncbi:MAG: sulfur carrier protein ThiS [Gammaproteobacteria bacterium]|uniref:Thiamine biosynthesis protein ThiS n=1 Tax=SAR86 cluster bacterium SAR86B TaxID=1123867 RepID=J4X4C6_9GAMM|nr:MAG: thiamine biosynthesis protein ThiS [SAR86 cluster bacterium SAR86B]
MNIFLNGVETKIEDNSLYTLLESLHILEKRFAVEINSNIIPSSNYKETQLTENDRVEIVIAVGGG